jgi:hypothetical protein
MAITHARSICGIVVLAAVVQAAAVAATAEEAAKLKSELTPFGAERAGNPAGTIPAWTGGYTTVPPGYRSGQPRPDPFANEKPLFRITAANMAQYADRLSEGTQALLRRFPTYRLDVYPAHRTAAAPQWVVVNTYSNATRAKTSHEGVTVEGAYGGIPFPIPKNGSEAMWNHLLAWKGESVIYENSTFVAAGGKPVLTTAGTVDVQYSYYDKSGSLDGFKGIQLLAKLVTAVPAARAGDIVLAHEHVDQYNEGRKAWLYLVGQRRVRRLPNITHDAPSLPTSGFTFADESTLFNGAMDRYDWHLVGKQEMFVPYNTHAFHTRAIDDVLGADHLNPEHVRWELHRVWVVEARLASGKRHAIAKRRFYLDEDSWQALLSDGWDANGQLWHVGYALPFIVPELPAVVTSPYVIYDLAKRGYAASSLFNYGARHYEVVPRRPEDAFSPAALAGEGVR